MRITVVGARGFLGGAIAREAELSGHEVVRCRHDAIPDDSLGVVIYCSGVAWGAEHRPADAFSVHAGSLLPILRSGSYERVLYVSSTRVYDRSEATREDALLGIMPGVISDAYSQSKIAGESLVLSASGNNRVVRLSNLFGPSLRSKLFLSDIVRQAVTMGRIDIRTSLQSAKDYVYVRDAARVIVEIAVRSKQQIYNVAAGYNTTHGAIIEAIGRVLDVDVQVPQDAPMVVTPVIETARLRSEFDFAPCDILTAIPEVVEAFRSPT